MEIHVALVVIVVVSAGLTGALLWKHREIETQMRRNSDEMRKIREQDCEDVSPPPAPSRQRQGGEETPPGENPRGGIWPL